jgi:hypothetical protein
MACTVVSGPVGRDPDQRLTKLTASRAAVITGAALFVAVLVGLILADWKLEHRVKSVTLVYVGAEHCAPCDVWQREQAIAFRDSAEFRQLTYREVKSPSLFDVLKDENWPEDLRVYRQTISHDAGVPLWLVIADDRLVIQGFGITQWQVAILPKIKSLLR